MKFRIGDLANVFGLTKESLRFYEKNKILNPIRDKENGYRYFGALDVQKLGIIKKLRNAEFSLEEIQKTYEGISIEEYYDIYNVKVQEITKDIFFKQHILNNIQKQQNIISNVKNNINKFKIVKCDTYYRRDFVDLETLLDIEEKYRFSSWFNKMLLVSASSKICAESLLNNLSICSRGLIIEKHLAHLFDLDLTGDIEEIESTNCAYSIIRFSDGKFDLQELKTNLNVFLDKEKLEICGQAFTKALFSHVDLNGDNVVYSEVFFPIKSLTVK